MRILKAFLTPYRARAKDLEQVLRKAVVLADWSARDRLSRPVCLLRLVFCLSFCWILSLEPSARSASRGPNRALRKASARHNEGCAPTRLKCHVPLVLSSLLATMTAIAEDERLNQLEVISVVAHRSVKPLEETPPNVSVIPRSELDERLVEDIKSLFFYEPNVSMSTEMKRRGNGTVNIRGIEGNRVLMQVDGVTLPDAYDARKGGTVVGRDLVDSASLAATEVIKGPFSAAYGSSALGGVVAYRTLEARDFVPPGQENANRFKVGVDTANRMHYEALTTAHADDVWSGLLQYVRRDGHGYKNSANTTSAQPNPVQWRTDAWLAKLKRDLGNGHEGFITVESFGRKDETQLDWEVGQTLIFGPSNRPRYNTLQSHANDDVQRRRVSVGARQRQAARFLFDELQWQIYGQQMHYHDKNVSTAAVGGQVLTDDQFNQKAYGAQIQLQKPFRGISVAHYLIYGAEWNQTVTQRPLNKWFSGSVVPATQLIGAQTLPEKPFPDNTLQQLGFFIQDEMVWENGFSLQPGIRYDRVEMRASPDADFLRNASITPKDFTDRAVTPKLLASYPVNAHWTLFAQYAAGFRSPPFNDAMLSMVNKKYAYEVVPNHNLQSERSQGLDIGVRGQWESSQIAFNLFGTRYKNFIEEVAIGKDKNNKNLQRYQMQNVGAVQLYGAELKADWRLQQRWRFRTSYGITQGKNRTTAKPVDSVNPPALALGIHYERPNWSLGAELSHTQRKKSVADPLSYVPPAFTTIDILGHYQLGPKVLLRGGIFNLSNCKYWLWSDVRNLRGLSPNTRYPTALIDRFTRPGRTYALSLQLLI